MVFDTALLELLLKRGPALKEEKMKEKSDRQSPPRDVSAPAEYAKKEIREALAGFARAIRSYDTRALERCVRVDRDAAGDLVKADMCQNCVIRRVHDAWTARFAEPIAFDKISFLAFPSLDGGFEILFEKTLENLDDAHIQIDCDRARVPFLFGGVEREPADSSLRKWRGAWIALVSDGLEWKIDLSATVRIHATMLFHPGALPGSTAEEEKINLAFTLDMNDMLLEAAQAVESGRFAGGPEASENIGREASKIFRKYNLYGLSLHPWPAKPTSWEMTR